MSGFPVLENVHLGFGGSEGLAHFGPSYACRARFVPVDEDEAPIDTRPDVTERGDRDAR